MIKRPIIIVDTETTGLDPSLGCEVIELAASALNYWDLASHHVGDFYQLIKPSRPEKAQQGAIDKTGDLFDRAKKDGLSAKVVWNKFAEYCEKANEGGGVMTKPILMAYNMNFDSKFIRFHMSEYKSVSIGTQGLPEFPWSFEFDAMLLGYQLFESDFYTDNIKLDTVLGKLNISRKSDIHNALEDVLLLKEFVVRCMTFSRKCAKLMKLPNTLEKK